MPSQEGNAAVIEMLRLARDNARANHNTPQNDFRRATSDVSASLKCPAAEDRAATLSRSAARARQGEESQPGRRRLGGALEAAALDHRHQSRDGRPPAPARQLACGTRGLSLAEVHFCEASASDRARCCWCAPCTCLGSNSSNGVGSARWSWSTTRGRGARSACKASAGAPPPQHLPLAPRPRERGTQD